MTYEEMQKTMQFILEQQAQFTVDVQQLKESQVKTTEVVTRLAALTIGGFEDTNAKISALIDAQMRTDENVRQLGEEVRNLTAVVDRYFRGRNGRTGSE